MEIFYPIDGKQPARCISSFHSVYTYNERMRATRYASWTININYQNRWRSNFHPTMYTNTYQLISWFFHKLAVWLWNSRNCVSYRCSLIEICSILLIAFRWSSYVGTVTVTNGKMFESILRYAYLIAFSHTIIFKFEGFIFMLCYFIFLFLCCCIRYSNVVESYSYMLEYIAP